jgi:hypothetical protein
VTFVHATSLASHHSHECSTRTMDGSRVLNQNASTVTSIPQAREFIDNLDFVTVSKAFELVSATLRYTGFGQILQSNLTSDLLSTSKLPRMAIIQAHSVSLNLVI